MVSFFVPGVPVPKGSAKAFVNKYTGRAQVMQTNRDRQQPWASLISYTAQQEGAVIIDGPVYLSVLFVMPRPKSHFGSGKNSAVLKPSAPRLHVSTPDLDKLLRCVKDALKSIAYNDDSQVVQVQTAKVYGQTPGVKIIIKEVAS